MDAAGEVAFEASADFPVGAAFCSPFLDVFPCFWVVGHPGQGDHVEDTVQASIAASVQAVPDSVAGGCGESD